MRRVSRGEEERVSGSGRVLGVGAEVEGGELTRAVEGARRGDEVCFAVAYRIVQPGVLRYVRTLVGEEAEDVAAEAWLQVSRDVREFRGDGDAFRGWVRAVARNRAVDYLRWVRSRPRQVAVPVEWESYGCGGGPVVRDAAEVVMDALATACVMRMVGALPPDQGEAVLLRVLVGLGSPEAGRVLGKQPGAVRMAAARGLRGLAEQVGCGSGRGAG
ncbi:RNA polymerase sigma factor [Streptomyces sp. NBC_00237]|uniref:RNA polymerase sigma factor n=1 Tax=Streptomyces sp. NBC_00237 TaxID=2975687 RepID=UPI00225C4329|nr:RNA polymerase sigma factor [Streptomyces sp. NBC_00237]MCX5202935.1 RNA polymerase sigma factor [Streptomyces sp. NBC_00237]